ncbi:hypothetical protein HYY75_08165, partial [bacterium]|nr:hypothetical protein [bacterium]
GTDWALAGIIRTSGNLGDFRRVANAQQSLIDLGNKTTDAWCDLGETLIRLNLFDDAGKAFEKASQIDPSCARAYQAPELIRIEKARSKGEKLFKDAKDAAAKKLFLTAVESLEHALELVPREITWMRFLADLCLRIGEITRAGELLSKVRVSNPGDFWVNFQLARVYEFEEKPQLALELLSSTLKDHPKEIEAHIMLLRLKRAQIPKDRLDKELITSFILKSRSDFLKMPKSEPLPLLVDGFTHYLLGGFSKFQAESLKKAEECFEEALSRFQDSIWAHRGLSLVFRVRGDFKLASKHIHEIVKLSSDPCLLYSLARFCENFQNFGEAKKYYASLRNLFPENGAFRKKVIEMIGREPAEGNKNPLLDFLTNCQETLRSTPNHVWTLFDVAFAQSLFAHGSQQKDEWNKRSMLTWNKVISQPDSPPWAWWNLIAAQRNSLKAGAERNRILNQHLSTCEKLVRDFPNVAEAHLALGESYLAFNDLAQTDKAVKHLEIAAFLEPESAEILHVLALSNRALGKSIRVDAIRDNMILLEPEFSARF